MTDQHERSTSAAQPSGPSHAERSRTLAARSRHGLLSTLTCDPAGYPYGSLVNFALEDNGSPLLLISGLAEHTANLGADPRASLLVHEYAAGFDPLALGRVTLVGRAARVSEDGTAAARELFLAVHPTAARYLGMRDFGFWRLTVESLRYIGGFGRMSWVDAPSWSAARPDPIAVAADGILAHMNGDHGTANMVYARAFAGIPDATAARMVAIDRYGFELHVETPDGMQPARVSFAAPLGSFDEVRGELVKLVAEGRARLG